MLQTCNRCKRRRIKCDLGLPACQACAKAGVECMFHDHGIQEDIPRSHIQHLDDKIHRLKASIECERKRQRKASESRGQDESRVFERSPPDLNYNVEDFNSPRNVSFESGVGQELPFLGCSSAAAFGRVFCQEAEQRGLSSQGSFDFMPTEKFKVAVDRSALTPMLLQRLLKHFCAVIRPSYPVVDESALQFDGPLKKSPTKKRYFVLITAGIGAAHLGRKSPSLIPVADMARDWALEISASVFAGCTLDSLRGLLLLAIYEFIDPSHGIVWNVVGLACRMALRLGLHREPREKGSNGLDSYLARRQVFFLLYRMERKLCHIFGRPTMLYDAAIKLDLHEENVLDADFMVQHSVSTILTKIHQGGTICPSSPELGLMIDGLGHGKGYEAVWLGLSRIVGHNCPTCEHSGKDYTSRITEAAGSIIEKAVVDRKEGKLLSIWTATSDIFVAGTALLRILLLAYDDNDTPSTPVEVENLRSCSSLLASFAEIWTPAQNYRDVFDGFMNAILKVECHAHNEMIEDTL